jgi:RNA-directed DNA polymerase
VDEVWGRKFLGYCVWAHKGEVKRAVATQVLAKMRERIRQLTSRMRVRSLQQIAEDLKPYVPGWKAYFRLAQTPKVMRELDEWLRNRLRAVQLKQWRRGTTMYREIRKLGAKLVSRVVRQPDPRRSLGLSRSVERPSHCLLWREADGAV